MIIQHFVKLLFHLILSSSVVLGDPYYLRHKIPYGEITLAIHSQAKQINKWSQTLNHNITWQIEGDGIDISCLAKNFPMHTRLGWIRYGNDNTLHRYNRKDMMNINEEILLKENLSESNNGSVFLCEATDGLVIILRESVKVIFIYKKSDTTKPSNTIRDKTIDATAGFTTTRPTSTSLRAVHEGIDGHNMDKLEANTAAFRIPVNFNFDTKLEDISPHKSNPKFNALGIVYNITKKIEGDSINIACIAKFHADVDTWKIYWVQQKESGRIPFKIQHKHNENQGEVKIYLMLTESDNSSLFYCESEFKYKNKEDFLTETSEKILFVYNDKKNTEIITYAHKDDATPKTNYMILAGIVVIAFVLILLILFVYQRRKLRNDSTDQSHKLCTETVQYAILSLPPSSSSVPRSGEQSQYAQVIGVLKPQASNIKM